MSAGISSRCLPLSKHTLSRSSSSFILPVLLVVYVIFWLPETVPGVLLMLPLVKKVDSFRIDVVPGLHGSQNHIQTYLVHYRDPELSPERENAMNLEYDKLQAYWKKAESFVNEKSGMKLSEKDKIKLESYQTALKNRDRFVAEGNEMFSGCGGNEIKAWTAHLDAKFANSSTHIKYHAIIKKRLLSPDEKPAKKKTEKPEKLKKEKPEKPKKPKKPKKKRRSDSRSVTPEEWRR